jgi:hypothetical protein
MYIHSPALIQQCQQKVRLHQRFAPGERNTSARLVVEYHVSFYFIHDLANSHLSPDYLPGTGSTNIHAPAAQHAFFNVGYRPLFNNRYSIPWAHICTLPTHDTPAFTKAHLGLVPPAFGIMAPQALQRAAFKEHGCANPRAVMYSVFLNIEYKSFCL